MFSLEYWPWLSFSYMPPARIAKCKLNNIPWYESKILRALIRKGQIALLSLSSGLPCFVPGQAITHCMPAYNVDGSDYVQSFEANNLKNEMLVKTATEYLCHCFWNHNPEKVPLKSSTPANHVLSAGIWGVAFAYKKIYYSPWRSRASKNVGSRPLLFWDLGGYSSQAEANNFRAGDPATIKRRATCTAEGSELSSRALVLGYVLFNTFRPCHGRWVHLYRGRGGETESMEDWRAVNLLCHDD